MELGKIEFEYFGVPMTAAYDNTRGWVCADETAERHLQLVTDSVPVRTYLPEPAREILEAGAAALGGKVTECLRLKTNTDPDVVH